MRKNDKAIEKNKERKKDKKIEKKIKNNRKKEGKKTEDISSQVLEIRISVFEIKISDI